MPDEDYDTIIATAAGAAASAAPLIIISPVSDAPAVAAIWGGMVYKICRTAGHDLDRDSAGRLALAVTAGAGTYWGGSKALSTVLAKIPFTMGPTVGLNAVLNAVFTFRLGHALVDLMENPDFDLADWSYLVAFLSKAMRPTPSVDELLRVRRLLGRLRIDRAS